MGRRLEEVDPQPQTLRELGVLLTDLWQQIPMQRCQTLIDSMPRRVRTLADARDVAVSLHKNCLIVNFFRNVKSNFTKI